MSRANELILGNDPEIVEALRLLGIDPERTYKVVLTFAVGQPVTVEVEKYTRLGETTALLAGLASRTRLETIEEMEADE